MKFTSNEISKYGLHDTLLNKIIVHDNGITLYFDKGIYLLSCTGKETELTKKCSIIFNIDSFDDNRIFERIIILKTTKGKIKEIEYQEFIEELNSSEQGLTINIDYYSNFAKSILIKGYINKNNYEFTITEIEKIDYIF